MNATEKANTVAAAITHHIRTRGFEPTKTTIAQIISETQYSNTYGTPDKMWVAEIRARYAPYQIADKAYTEAIRTLGSKAHESPAADAFFVESGKYARWTKKIIRLTLKNLKGFYDYKSKDSMTIKAKLRKAIDNLERHTNVNTTGVGEHVCQFCYAHGHVDIEHCDDCPIGELWRIVNEEMR